MPLRKYDSAGGTGRVYNELPMHIFSLRFVHAQLFAVVVASGQAGVLTPPPSDGAEDEQGGWRPTARVRNEFETGHVMLGRIVTTRPRWVLDAGAGFRHDEWGRFEVSCWNASDFTHEDDDMRNPWFNEVDPMLTYGWTWRIADGWGLDSEITYQRSEMRGYKHAATTYRQWIWTETLMTPWVDVYAFTWSVVHPYNAPAYRLGARKSIPLGGGWSLEPHLFVDAGPERWIRRRFGEWTDRPAHYRFGPDALSFHLHIRYQLGENVSLYAGIRQYDLIVNEIRRQTKARPGYIARRDLTYFAIGLDIRF